MNLPSDFNNARPYTGASSFNMLPPGGHICRIIGARMTQSSAGNDMIEVAFDVAEGGPDDGRFQQQFDERRAARADAKWPAGGMFRTAILTKDGKTSGYFKGLITAIEESNPGYSFAGTGANEGTLKGKMIGFNFGEEEYKGNDGKIRTSVKAAYAVSVQTVRDGIEPPKKKTLAPQANSGFVEVPNDDQLPF